MLKSLIKAVVKRFPALALFCGNSRDLLDQRHPARKTPWGFSLAGHDAMAKGYPAITANEAAVEITPELAQKIVAGTHRLDTHNFIFIPN